MNKANYEIIETGLGYEVVSHRGKFICLCRSVSEADKVIEGLQATTLLKKIQWFMRDQYPNFMDQVQKATNWMRK
jgi:hypothetical protein